MKIGNTRIRPGRGMIGVGALARAVFVLGLYLPANARTRERSRQLTQLQQEADAVAGQVAAYDASPEQLDQRRARLRQQRDAFALEQDVSALVRLLTDQTRQWADVQVVNIRPAKVESGGRGARRQAVPEDTGPVARRFVQIVLRTSYT